MKTGSRTLGTMVGGAAGFVVGGPVGAVAAGVAAGAAMDGIITGVDSAVHQEFRPMGQIAAWNAVAQGKSSEEIIGGVIGGVVTPVMDGVIGLGSGKAYGKWKLSKDLKTLERFMEGDGSVGLDEAFDAMEGISKNKTRGVAYAEVAESLEDATFDGQPIPKEAITDESVTVYRGDRGLLRDPGMMEVIFEEGVETRGPVNDALMHARGAKDCNYVSTSKDFGVARRFGKLNRRQPQSFGVMKINARRGVDLQIAADMLDRLNPFPAQAEVSIFEGILPQNIEGVLVSDINGGFTWHANPNYVPAAPPAVAAAANPNAIYFIGAVLVVSADLFQRSFNSQQQ